MNSSNRSTVRALAILYASTVMSGTWAMLVPVIPVLASAFQISAGTAAQIITALSLGRFAGMPVSGAILDRLGTRASLIAGPAIACAAAVLATLAPWFSLMLIPVFLIGVADSIWVIAREVAGVDLVRPDQRGRVLSGFHGINYIGLALGPLIGGVLTENFGFRAVFLAYGACAAISVLLGFTVENRLPAAHPASSDARVKGRGAAAMRQRLAGLRALFDQIEPHLRATYAVLVLATLTSFAHRVATQSLIPVYASAALGMTPKEIGLLFTISGLSVFIMILPAGFVIDKVGRKWATVPSTGIPAVAFMLIPFSTSIVQYAILLA
jgi:MFS family permease